MGMLRGLHATIASGVAALSIVGAAHATELTSAWEDVGYLDYRRALPQFESARKGAADSSPEWQQATLGMALCLHQRQPDTKADKERAAELYDALIAASDKVPIQATALLLRGKLDQLVDYFGDEENFAGAATFYERVLRDWPDSSSAGEAALYLGQTAVYTMDKDAARKAIAQLKIWAHAHPDNPYAASHWLLIALGHRMPLENQGAAVEASLNALKAGLPKEMKVDLLYWRIATMARNSGNLEVARDFYTRIIVEVQRSSYTYMAQEQIREIGFEAPELVDPFEN